MRPIFICCSTIVDLSFLLLLCSTDLVALLALAQRHIPGARLVEDVGREAVINLPQTSAEDSSLAIFLKELDLKKGELGITSYGLSDTTLEEVMSHLI